MSVQILGVGSPPFPFPPGEHRNNGEAQIFAGFWSQHKGKGKQRLPGTWWYFQDPRINYSWLHVSEVVLALSFTQSFRFPSLNKSLRAQGVVCGDKSPTPLSGRLLSPQSRLSVPGAGDFISPCLPSANCCLAHPQFKWHLEILSVRRGLRSGFGLLSWAKWQLREGPGEELMDDTRCLADPRQWPLKSIPAWCIC